MSRNLLSHRTAGVGEPGISPSGIEALERNPDRQPTDQTILLLGEALGATDDEFLPTGSRRRERCSTSASRGRTPRSRTCASCGAVFDVLLA